MFRIFSKHFTPMFRTCSEYFPDILWTFSDRFQKLVLNKSANKPASQHSEPVSAASRRCQPANTSEAANAADFTGRRGAEPPKKTKIILILSKNFINFTQGKSISKAKQSSTAAGLSARTIW